MKLASHELADVWVEATDTPDGQLTTFEWRGEQSIVAIGTEFIENAGGEEFLFDYMLPWPLERIGEDVETGIVYFQRTDMK